LETLGAISNTFEGSPEAREANDEMEAVFGRLYLDGESQQLEPVAALGLYFDFRELTPVGADGDQMVRNLADRLVSLDLLGRAAELIDFQVNFRLRGAEKARVAAKLAAIYLLDRQPEMALEALGKSRFRAIPGSLLRERRYLQTRALIELQRFDDAQRLIARDQSIQANALRADVYWSTSDWSRAAGAFEIVLDNRQDADELSLQERNQVMQMTVAYALANDREAIDDVRNRYGDLMSVTEDASAFEVLTSNPDRASIGFREVASRIAQINTLDSFMDRYRSDLKNDGVGAID
jgi:ethanolamine utilization microcompartment shell protein EutS